MVVLLEAGSGHDSSPDWTIHGLSWEAAPEAASPPTLQSCHAGSWGRWSLQQWVLTWLLACAWTSAPHKFHLWWDLPTAPSRWIEGEGG